MSIACKNGSECTACMSCIGLKSVLECYNCHDGIYDGEEYFELLGNPYCKDCVTVQTAESEEF